MIVPWRSLVFKLVALFAIKGLAHVATAHSIFFIAPSARVALNAFLLILEHLLILELFFTLLERWIEAKKMLPPSHLGYVAKDCASSILTVAIKRLESNFLRWNAIVDLGSDMCVET